MHWVNLGTWITSFAVNAVNYLKMGFSWNLTGKPTVKKITIPCLLPDAVPVLTPSREKQSMLWERHGIQNVSLVQ